LRVIVRIVVGLGLTVVAFAVAGRRLWWLKRLALSGQPAPERLEYAKSHAATEASEAVPSCRMPVDVSLVPL
jgi:hypothetical protein